MRLILPIFFFFIIISIPCMAFAASNKDDAYHVVVPELLKSPKIDGKLEKALWEKAAILESFTQYEPREGTGPSEKTVAYIGYDRKNLYIAIRCYDSDPKAIRRTLTQRDKVFGDDGITIYLDTFNDKKRAFAFEVNPCGVQSDGVYTETKRRRRGTGFNKIDKNWDTYFLANARIDKEGYTVEISIPFKSLRFPNSGHQIWGLQIMRQIQRKNEEIYWHPRSRSINGFLIQAGEIRIDGKLDTGKNLEIMPVATGLKTTGESSVLEAGLNLKYGLTSDLTADLTLNPDFSQVEADIPQIDVNQRFALYYPEKRPFFLEGKDFFDTPLELVYTRTIINPDMGVKLTGKFGRTTVGFLSTYDANPAEIDIPFSSAYSGDSPMDRGLVNILRVKQDLFEESHIGFIVTDKEMGQSLGDITRNFNRVFGVDGHFKFKDYYRFTFQVLGSQSEVGTERTGFVPAMTFNLSRNTRHMQFSAEYLYLPEDFEASSGFFNRKDIKQFRTRISYVFLPQNEWIVDIRPSIEYRRAWDFNNILTDNEFRIGGFLSGWRGSFLWCGFTTEMERYNGIDFHRKGFRASLSSAPFAWLSGMFSFSFGEGIYYSDDPYLGYKTSFGFMLILKPVTNFRLFYNFKNEKFLKNRGGERVYSINIISQRIGYQISKTLSLRLITDYNAYYKEMFNSLLLSWELRPGTVFYIGMDDNREEDDIGIFRNQGKVFFIKFSYWWRV